MQSRYFRNLRNPSFQLLTMLALTALIAAALLAGYSPLGPDSLLLGGAALIGNMTPGQARVIDPVLTTVAQGYRNGEMVADALFPVVPVGQRGGKIITFGRESFRLYATARAPGAATKRVQFGYAGEAFALEQHSLEGLVPIEQGQEAAAVPGIDLGSGAVRSVQDIIALSREVAAASLALNAANYDANHKVTLSGTDKWSDYSAVSNPLTDVDDAIEVVRASTGQRPNTVLLSPKAFKAVRRHPKVLAWFNNTNQRSVASREDLAMAFDVKKVVVGDAVYDNGNATVDVWGSDAVVAFTQLGTLANGGLPSYGYTYRLGGYPLVEQPYHERNAKSWIYPVTDELSPVIASAIAGFLIKGAA